MRAGMEAKELVYEAAAHFTNMVEYGPSLQSIIEGKAGPPPEGARFDASFEGTLTGPKLKGKVHGVDYVSMRADGRVELHIHAQVDSADGAKISLFADGVGTLDPKAGILHLRENATLRSNAPAHSWVNTIQIWAEGKVDFAKGEIKVSGYKA